MKNKNQTKENWEKLIMRIEKVTLDCYLNSISQEEARDEILELLKSEREKWLKEEVMAIEKKLVQDMLIPEWLEIIQKAIEKAKEEERRKILSEFEKRIPTGYYPPTNSKPIIEN